MDKQEFRNEKLYQTTMLMARKMLSDRERLLSWSNVVDYE